MTFSFKICRKNFFKKWLYFGKPLFCRFSETNQDHRLSRWFALPLEGAITSCACKRIESPPSALLSQLPPLAAIFICSLLLFHPWTGQCTHLNLFDLPSNLLLTDCWYILESFLYSFPLYQHNILYTKMFYFHICILSSHFYQK